MNNSSRQDNACLSASEELLLHDILAILDVLSRYENKWALDCASMNWFTTTLLCLKNLLHTYIIYNRYKGIILKAYRDLYNQ